METHGPGIPFIRASRPADERRALHRFWIVIAALAIGAANPSWAGPKEDEKAEEPVRHLLGELHRLDTRVSPFTVQRQERLRILGQIAELKTPSAIRALAKVSRNPDYVDLQGDILRMMIRIDDDSYDIVNELEEHMHLDSPHRQLARDYLLAHAVRHRRDDWIEHLFQSSRIEDRFLALDAMGRIGSTATLQSAWKLLDDDSWQPDDAEGSRISCATIAASVKELEGTSAAQLLLLLERDPRFRAADRDAIRETTRLWARRDLTSYIDLAELRDPDLARRERTVRFLGKAGIEMARAPLVFLARNRGQPASVRGAAATALGGLRIARSDLVPELTALTKDAESDVRRGAVVGLGRLGIRPAAEELVAIVGGPLEEPARAQLAKMTAQPGETDWAHWLKSPDCELPDD